MIKFNDKQRKLLKIYAAILFSIILVIVLNNIFDARKNSKYVGKWTIGYNMYDEGKLSYKFLQKLKLNKDGTFSTEESTEPDNGLESFVSGTYEIDGSKIILKYNQFKESKEDTYFYQEGKICTTIDCNHYYTKDSKTVYFDIKAES